MTDKCRLLIADPSEAVRESLSEVLSEHFDICTCLDSRTALELLYRFQPHIMLLDLMLPGMDGLSLLQAAVDGHVCPAVLATTRYENDYILDAAYRLGVSYIILRPCTTAALAERIWDIRRRFVADASTDDLTFQVKCALVRLGFPTLPRGYALLRDAILWRRENPNAPITKELYPAIAKRHRISAHCAEKDIRMLLHATWENRDPQLWQLYFPANERPSNGVFISRIAESLPTDLELTGNANV